MSWWYEKDLLGKIKDVTFVMSIAAVAYFTVSNYVFHRPERQALRINDGIGGKDITIIEDPETQNAICQKTGKLFVIPTVNGDNRVYTFVPVNDYMTDEIQAYIQAYIMIKQQEKNQEIMRAIEEIQRRHSTQDVTLKKNIANPDAAVGTPVNFDAPVGKIRNGQWVKIRDGIQLELAQ